MGVVSTIASVHHPIHTLPEGIGNTLVFLLKISKFSFQLTVQVYSFLDEKREKKGFFGGWKKEGRTVRLTSRALGCHLRWKSLCFCEIWNVGTLLFFIRTYYKSALQGMELNDNFVDRFQDLPNVENTAVSKAKVWKLLRVFQRKRFGEYDAVTLTMLYLKVLHDMVSQNS